MSLDLGHDANYFHELQTSTGWGQILGSFTRWCAPQPGKPTLDIGTGPGLLPALFTEQVATAIGIDLDMEMFSAALHKDLAFADAAALPFKDNTFEIVTASNVLYLDKNPQILLAEIARVCSGRVCLLNPSENISVTGATELANERNLNGLARETLINFAQLAEDYYRWSQEDLSELFFEVGLTLTNTTLRMGKGLIRYVAGRKIRVS